MKTGVKHTIFTWANVQWQAHSTLLKTRRRATPAKPRALSPSEHIDTSRYSVDFDVPLKSQEWLICSTKSTGTGTIENIFADATHLSDMKESEHWWNLPPQCKSSERIAFYPKKGMKKNLVTGDKVNAFQVLQLTRKECVLLCLTQHSRDHLSVYRRMQGVACAQHFL